MSQHRHIIRVIGGLDTRIRFRVGVIDAGPGVSRSAIYKVLWRLQLIGAVKHHGYDWSIVRHRWRKGIDALIEDYEWITEATPATQALIERGQIESARSTFKKE